MKSTFYQIVVLLIIFVVSVSAQQVRIGGVSYGACPHMPDMKDFDMEKFKGVWHELERSFYLLEVSAKCTTYNFNSSDKNGRSEVVIKSVNRWTENPVVHLGKVHAWRKTSPAVLDYKASTNLPDIIARALPRSGTYHIIDTDYENYAVMWSCSNMRFIHSDNLWVLGRTRHIPAEVRAKVYNLLHEIGFDSDRLLATKNEKCPSF